jgi:uncharacterized membrane protein
LSFVAGMGAWLLGGAGVWLIAALFIGAVVPITFIVIMPTNRRLLAAQGDHGAEETRRLLERWGRLHALRSVAAMIAVLLMLSALAF